MSSCTLIKVSNLLIAIDFTKGAFYIPTSWTAKRK